MNNQKLTGKVKFFNDQKGFGFIRHDNSDTETFVHVKNCGGIKPKENDRVTFETEETDRGTQAINVALI